MFKKYYNTIIMLPVLTRNLLEFRNNYTVESRHPASPLGWVQFVGWPADLQGGRHIFFKCGPAGEQTRVWGGQHFSRGGPAPVGPSSRRYGAAFYLLSLAINNMFVVLSVLTYIISKTIMFFGNNYKLIITTIIVFFLGLMIIFLLIISRINNNAGAID